MRWQMICITPAFLFAGTATNVLAMDPNNGLLPPKGELAVSVFFKPAAAAAYNFNVRIAVTHINEPLRLNVKGSGYILCELFALEGLDGHYTDLTPGIKNRVDFGEVCLSTRSCLHPFIKGLASTPEFFAWCCS